jgi:uncharacterized protein DUF2795
MDRTTNKHGPRLDEGLEGETASLERGSPVEARREQSREKEGPGDDQPMPESAPGGEPDGWSGQEIDRRDVRAREQIGQAIAGSFPANREELLARAVQSTAMTWVVEELRALPGNGPFENVEAVWEALGGRTERRV